MVTDYDVVVIGAGFAGVTAARECAVRGLRTLILEGRDRIGGRTHTTALSTGEPVDIGGTHIHPFQPHIWSEINRYGLAGEVVKGRPAPEWLVFVDGADVNWIRWSEHAANEKRLLEQAFRWSREVFPEPHQPLRRRGMVDALDELTVATRVDQLRLDADDATVAALYMAERSGHVPGEASFSGALRAWALSGHSYVGYHEMLGGYKLKSGTVRVLEEMLADGGAELRLNAAVSAITASDDGVRVDEASGRMCTASAVVVATPPGVWPDLGFSPALPAAQLRAANEGMQAPSSGQAAVVLRGETRSIVVEAGAELGSLLTSEIRSHDEQLAMFFPGPGMADGNDPAQIAAAITSALPHVEILEILAGSYRTEDPFSRGGWGFLRPGQLTRDVPHQNFVSHGDGVVFATSDIAREWHGTIDGAVESGLRAARLVRAALAHRR